MNIQGGQGCLFVKNKMLLARLSSKNNILAYLAMNNIVAHGFGNPHIMQTWKQNLTCKCEKNPYSMLMFLKFPLPYILNGWLLIQIAMR